MIVIGYLARAEGRLDAVLGRGWMESRLTTIGSTQIDALVKNFAHTTCG